MNRRSLLGFLAASAAIGGCANNIMGKTLARALETSFGSSSAFEPDYPDRLPYASLAVTLKNNQRALLILAKAESGELHWVSADRGVLVTRNGRLVRTVGLPENLIRTDFVGKDFFEEKGLPDENPASSRRLIDVAPGNRYGILVDATLVRGEKDRTKINNRLYDTVRFDEHCSVPGLSWRFVNSYWIDDRRNVWRSIQHISPGVAPLEIEVTKPLVG